MRSGLRPVHSVETITCTSEMSGTASSGVLVIAQMPQTVMITVLVNTRNRFDAHQSMIRSIIDVYSARRVPRDLLGGDGDFLLSDFLAVLPDADRRVPFHC